MALTRASSSLRTHSFLKPPTDVTHGRRQTFTAQCNPCRQVPRALRGQTEFEDTKNDCVPTDDTSEQCGAIVRTWRERDGTERPDRRRGNVLSFTQSRLKSFQIHDIIVPRRAFSGPVADHSADPWLLQVRGETMLVRPDYRYGQPSASYQTHKIVLNTASKSLPWGLGLNIPHKNV